jgi:hypothetical protein
MKTILLAIPILLVINLCMSDVQKIKFAQQVSELIHSLSITKPDSFMSNKRTIKLEAEAKGKDHVSIRGEKTYGIYIPFLDISIFRQKNQPKTYAFNVSMPLTLLRDRNILSYYQSNSEKVNVHLSSLIFSFKTMNGELIIPDHGNQPKILCLDDDSSTFYLVFIPTRQRSSKHDILKFFIAKKKFQISYSNDILPEELKIKMNKKDPTYKEQGNYYDRNNDYARGAGPRNHNYQQNGYKAQQGPSPTGGHNLQKEPEMTFGSRLKSIINKLLGNFDKVKTDSQLCNLLNEVKTAKSPCLDQTHLSSITCNSDLKAFIRKLSLVYNNDKLTRTDCDERLKDDLIKQQFQVDINTKIDEIKKMNARIIL